MGRTSVKARHVGCFLKRHRSVIEGTNLMVNERNTATSAKKAKNDSAARIATPSSKRPRE